MSGRIINKSAIRRSFHFNGLRTSNTFLNGLEEFVLIQVNHAQKTLKHAGKTTAHRQHVSTLLPVTEGFLLPKKTTNQKEPKKS